MCQEKRKVLVVTDTLKAKKLHIGKGQVPGEERESKSGFERQEEFCLCKS